MREIPLVIEPDPDEPGCALPFVDVLIDGRSYPFVLDTGARTSVLVADDHTTRLVRVGLDRSAGLFESRVSEMVEVGRVELGGISAERVPMSLTDPDDPSAGSLLGMDVLGGRALRLDLHAGTLQVLASGQPGPVLDRDAAGHCFVPVTWPGGLAARACIDTGAAITVLDARFAAQHPELLRDQRTSVGRGNGGIQVETPTFTLEPYSIGGITFEPHSVAVVEIPLGAEPTELILGYPSLVQAVWTLDLGADTWSIAAAAIT